MSEILASQQDSVSGMLYRAFHSTEDERYKAYFKKDCWSLEEFACLLASTIPEVYQGVLANDEKYVTSKNLKRAIEANNIMRQFLRELEEVCITERILDHHNYMMSAWRFIKWTANKNLPIKRRFLDALPYPLLDIFLEFSSESSSLHKPKSSQAYHRALYLKAARNLIGKLHYRLSRNEIYAHPHMQSVLLQIRALGGHYTKRTIIDSWLAKLEERKKGRPKKHELLEK